MLSMILKHLAESTIFAVILAMLILCLRHLRASAAVRHRLWLLAFAKFAIPFSLLSAAGASLASLGFFKPSMHGPVADISRLLSRAAGNPTLVVSSSVHQVLTVSLLGCWFAGSSILFVIWICRLRKSAFSLAAPADAERIMLEKARERLGIRKDVQLGISEEVPEPLLRGVVHPALVLPQHLSVSLNKSELEAVILHELAHVRRGDNLIASLAHMISLAFWFHPLLWWMERQLLIDCECACDEVVVHTLGAQRDYVLGILKVCRFALSDVVPGVSGIGGWKLKKRLELIMSYSKDQAASRAPRSLVGVVAATLLLMPMVSGFLSRGVLQAETIERRKGIEFVSARTSGNSVESEQVLSALKTLLNPNEMGFDQTAGPFNKWVNEDVSLIIAPSERAAFLALTSDPERQNFIAQFWERRNPTPGAPTNAFKEQYYRRIAYANKHFAKHDVAGWQTDRGRTYIVLGPPDEIDSHPDQNREFWLYRQVSRTPDDLYITFDISNRE